MSTSHKFSLDNFKRWIKDNHDQDYLMNRPQGPVGNFVESKASAKKIVTRMTTECEDKEKMAEEFVESGGRITEVNGVDYLIEVSSGSFYISRMYVKKS